jgi:hypothetical protein
VLGSYRIADQFDRVHDREEVAAGPALYVVADRHGTTALAEWTRGLRTVGAPAGMEGAPAGASVAVVPVVSLPGIPRLLRGAIRRMLPRAPEAWVLVDFDGVFEHLVTGGASCTVAVVAPSGEVVARSAVGEFRAGEAASLVAQALALR